MKYNFCVFIEEKSKRVDIYLSTLFKDFSRSYIQKIIDKGDVELNGIKITKNIKIKNKDEILIKIKLEKLDKIQAEKMNLDVIYEDEEILVLNKDSGINVHPVPGFGGNKNTLVNGILEHCKNKLPSIGGIQRPGIVHRLDKDTSGVIMIAKTDKMMNYLSNIIKNRRIEKYYLAIVYGKIKTKHFKIESYIGRDPNNRIKMTTKNPISPKIAVSYGEVIDFINNKYSLVKIKIETGRTHQIRVHMASLGYPIIGDKTYGNSRVNKEVATKFQLHRQALHSWILKLKLYGNNVKFEANIKNDIKKLLDNKTLGLLKSKND